MSDGPEQGREKRSGVIIRAIVDFGGWSEERRVRNLSEHGACIDDAGDLSVGQQIRVTMGRLEGMVARVMWTRDKLAGLQFDKAIDLQEARAPRGAGQVKSGWMTDINHAYRKRS